MSIAHDAPALTAESTVAYQRQVQEAATFLRERMSLSPSLGLTVATGRDSVLPSLTIEKEWSAEEIPNVPVRDAQPLAVLSGTLANVPILVLKGTPTLHDGFTARQVAFPIRMLGEVGADTLLTTNTAGSVASEISPADLVLVTDHINFQGVNPLVGPNVEEWGPRFPDMSEPYDPELRQTADAVALREGIQLHKGIYFSVLGPNLGTQAEYRMVRTLGADLVGTGSVLEVIAARHMDLRVMTLSVITDRCSPDAAQPVPASQMTEACEAAQPQLRRLLHEIVASFDDAPAA
jgi:purine-nucleoside phosphorylase